MLAGHLILSTISSFAAGDSGHPYLRTPGGARTDTTLIEQRGKPRMKPSRW
jgi:hypothetical protein